MKKKNTMVRYTLVPDSEDSNVPSQCCLKCPKLLTLSKSKLITGAVIGVVALGIILLSVSHSNAWKFTKNMTECLHPDKNDSGNRHDISLYKKRFPQAIIIGARKGGTRALLRFLNIHHDVIVSKHEAHFFDRNYDNGYAWYLDQMPESYPGQITMEKTPNYLVDLNTPERIYQFNSSIKLVLILRDPVDRAVSDYLQLKVKYPQPELTAPFESFVIERETGEINISYSPIKRSLYCNHMERWLTRFNRSQILIVDGENIKVNPWEEMYKVEKFLGVDHELHKGRFVFNASKGFYCIKVVKPHSPWKTIERCLSSSKGRPHPTIDPAVRQKLDDYFRPCNEKLFDMIGMRFNWDKTVNDN